MTSKSTFNHFLKILAGSFVCGATLVASPSAIKAATCATNPSSLSTSCTITPERYVITIYEMGFCLSDPLSGTNFDANTCTASITSAAGMAGDIAGSMIDLTGDTQTRPPNGTYPYAYVKMSNSFGLRGSYELDDTTYYSDASGGATGSSSTNFTSTLIDFNGGATCTGSPSFSDSASLTGGDMKARIAGTDGTTTATSCSGSAPTRVIGSFEPNAPIVITDETRGLEVRFITTGTAMTIIPNGEGSAVQTFDGGPFQPQFLTF